MRLPVVWIPEADADLKETLAWYEKIRPELGLRFALAVDAIAQSPLRFQIVRKELRRAGVRRFPFGLFFKVETDRIVVIACLHGRRDPSAGNCVQTE